MKPGELEHDLSITNVWWRRPISGRSWEQDDRDLRAAAEAPFIYKPAPLRDIQPGGLYVLAGPRRVGKSVEIKRAISETILSGMDPRRVIHAACNGWRARDLTTLMQLADDLAPPEGGPRFLFLDEITAINDDWVGRVAWLRDQTAMRHDCVVLSGSSAERLEQARSDLAGRRGPAEDSTRILLPLGFRSFCRLRNRALPQLPRIHPRDMLGADAAAAIRELRPYLETLVSGWERYLQIGGFPKAISDWINNREISPSFVQAIWDVIHGDALRGGNWTPAQTQSLLEAIARHLSSRTNKSDVRRDLGEVHHDVLDLRLQRLHDAFVIWPCYLNEGGRPNLDAQAKVYFVDPLHARLAYLRRAHVRPPDFTELTEQQLGVTLLAAHELEAPGSWKDADTLLYYRSSTDNEVDFTGHWLGDVPYEGKYTQGAWIRDTQTATTAYGRCVLATRTTIGREADRMAIPAAFLAYLLDADAEARPLDAGESSAGL